MCSINTRLGTHTATFISAARIQHSVLAKAETRALSWLAARTPRSINSDHLTLLGFGAQCSAGACYALSKLNPDMLLVAILCLVVNWLGDSLDGTLARFRNRQRPRYGFYVDHVADTISAFFLMGGLAISGYVHAAIASGMLIAFLMLSIETYLATYALGRFHLSHWMFGPTEIRILLALGNIALLRNPLIKIFGRSVLLFDVGGLIAIVGMSIFLIVSAVRHTLQLYREEKLL